MPFRGTIRLKTLSRKKSMRTSLFLLIEAIKNYEKIHANSNCVGCGLVQLKPDLFLFYPFQEKQYTILDFDRLKFMQTLTVWVGISSS